MRAKRRSSGLAPSRKRTQPDKLDDGNTDEVDIYEGFDLGGLTKEEVIEIDKVAPPGQRLQDVLGEDSASEGPKMLYNQLRKTSARIDEAFQQTYRKFRMVNGRVPLC